MCGGGWVCNSILVSAPVPMETNWVLELIGTCIGVGPIGGLGAQGVGPGLDNK